MPPSAFIIIDDLYEPFLEKFTAGLTAVTPEDPSSEHTTIGPLSSSLATERLADQVSRAVEAGADDRLRWRTPRQLLPVDRADGHRA